MSYKLVDGQLVKEDANFLTVASSKRELFIALIAQTDRVDAEHARGDTYRRRPMIVPTVLPV